MSPFFSRCLVAGLVSLAFAAPASAEVKVNFVETATGVNASFAGSLDLTGLFGPLFGGSLSGIDPSSGGIRFTTAVQTDRWVLGVEPLPFGSGGAATPTSLSGDAFAFFVNVSPPGGGGSFPGPTILLPFGYVSGSTLSGSASFAGATLSSLGIGLGPVVNTLGNGDKITIFATPVPEPGAYALMLAGLGVLGFTARRRQKQMKGVQA
jgi:PEP-CTERM motif